MVGDSEYRHGRKLHHCLDYGAYRPPRFRILEKENIAGPFEISRNAMGNLSRLLVPVQLAVAFLARGLGLSSEEVDGLRFGAKTPV